VRAFQSDISQPESLQITIDKAYAATKNGDKVTFNTVIMNNGATASPPMIVAMNIVNLDETGDVVDPEDWSPQRTQYIKSIAPGESVMQPWILNTILEGEYMVYAVLIPAPASSDSTSHPISSPGVHVTVTHFARLNPGGILPLAIGIPAVLLLLSLVLGRLRSKGIDAGVYL
jgi:hypothetical protein